MTYAQWVQSHLEKGGFTWPEAKKTGAEWALYFEGEGVPVADLVLASERIYRRKRDRPLPFTAHFDALKTELVLIRQEVLAQAARAPEVKDVCPRGCSAGWLEGPDPDGAEGELSRHTCDCEVGEGKYHWLRLRGKPVESLKEYQARCQRTQGERSPPPGE